MSPLRPTAPSSPPKTLWILRDKKITAIIPLDEYTYDNVPVVNGRGFEVRAASQEKIAEFLSEYSQTPDSEKNNFFAKWVSFDKYRKVVFKAQ